MLFFCVFWAVLRIKSSRYKKKIIKKKKDAEKRIVVCEPRRKVGVKTHQHDAMFRRRITRLHKCKCQTFIKCESSEQPAWGERPGGGGLCSPASSAHARRGWGSHTHTAVFSHWTQTALVCREQQQRLCMCVCDVWERGTERHIRTTCLYCAMDVLYTAIPYIKGTCHAFLFPIHQY